MINPNGVAIRYSDVAPEAKENFTPATSDKESFVNLSELQLYEAEFRNYGNPCEVYSVPLDGNSEVFPTDAENALLGLWSNSISGSDGRFETPVVLSLTASGQYSSQGITLTFDTYNNIFATDINIKWYRSGELLSDMDFSPSSASYFCRNQVDNYDEVQITFRAINMPGNRLKLRVIDYGYDTVFYGSELRGVKLIRELDPISSKIAINTCDFTLDSKTDMEYSFQAKQPLSVYFNGKLLATTFVKTSKRRARRLWDTQSEDYIGIMDSIPFYGGMYNGKDAYELLEEIFTVAKVPYSIDESLRGVLVYGYIPFTTCREATMQVCFAVQNVVDTSNSDAVKVLGSPRNVLSKSRLGERIQSIDNSVSKVGYICPEGQTIIFGHTTELDLKASQEYTLSFYAWCNKNYSVCWDLWVAPNVGDENFLPQEWFDVTPTPALYQWTFKVDEDFMPKASMRFLNVIQNGEINNVLSPIYITDIQIEEGSTRTPWSPSKYAEQTIPLNRIMQGQSFTDEETVTGVEVTAHTYKPITETVDVYSATESGTGEGIFVKFSEPLHDLSITNGAIITSGANYAVITANSGCVLKGQKYEHTTISKRKENPLVLAGTLEKVVAIENATLVSATNVDEVLNKCYTWLVKTNTTNLKIVEGKHVSEDGTVTYDEPVNVGDVIESETEYLGTVSGRIIKETFGLNGGIVIKEAVLK